MKKIILLSVFAVISMPSFAEETSDVSATSDQTEEIKVQDTTVETESVQTQEVSSESKAAKFPSGLEFGLGASVTSGINGFVGYANKNFESFWWKRLGARFDFATTSPIKSEINSAINSAISNDGADVGDGVAIHNASLSANHFGALLDFYPFGDTWFMGGWRLTGGYMFGKLQLAADLTSRVEGAPTDSMEFELNDVQYRYNGGSITGTADAKWKYSGPYLGTGFDIGLLWGVKVYMDAGVVFTNKTAKLNLNVPITDRLQYWDGSSWIAVDNDSLKATFNTNKELALRDANNELDKYKIFPMVKLGFMYRF